MPDTEIYLIPGLGFDCRIFRHLDWGAHPVVHLNWIEPEEAEGLTHYARRLAAGLEDCTTHLSPLGKKTRL